MNHFAADKKIFRVCVGSFLLILLVALSACSPAVSIVATGTDGATLSFKTGFSPSAEQTIKSLMGTIFSDSAGDEPLFNANDISAMMRTAGLQNVVSSAPNASAIATNGSTTAISETVLAQAGVLTRTTRSLTLTLGAKQFQTLYALLDEESQAYFDLMMIPALTDDELTPADYNDLLASVYGKTFADELTAGTLSIALTSPDGKKTTTAKATLGEILTLAAEKSWSVSW